MTALQFMYPNAFGFGRLLLIGGLAICLDALFTNVRTRAFWGTPGWHRANAVFALIAASVAVYLAPKPPVPPPAYLTFTSQQKDEFIHTLDTVFAPSVRLRFGCDAEPSICVRGAKSRTFCERRSNGR
jgi:hypothetical protein